VQRDLGHGMILDASYVGNVAHHGFGSAYDANAIGPLTTWSPTPTQPKYLDPTSGGGGTGAFYATNLIKALVGIRDTERSPVGRTAVKRTTTRCRCK